MTNVGMMGSRKDGIEAVNTEGRVVKMDDLAGRQFGRLTVIEFAGTHTAPCGTKRKMWRCKCECGKESIVNTSNLLNGTTKSCGCWKYEKIKQHNTIHGGSRDRLYRIWKSMKHRCNNQNDSRYEAYGGKGISVCDEWSDYECFKVWAYSNGYNEDAEYGECTIDRIDNNDDYKPSNCRFVNRIVQANNTSRNHFVEMNGHKMTIAEFARVMNISKNHARYYIDKFEREVVNGQSYFASGSD